MTIPMRTLKNDPRGTAAWIEREARGMDPMQLYREFVQNGIEARRPDKPAVVIIDYWTDPETGHHLARITDNGCGMNRQQLIERLTNLHGQYKADNNYGVGARIAALPFNHAGVTFASRSTHGDATVTLHKYRGEYGMKSWEVQDADGDLIYDDVVAPDEGMLDRLPEGSTGTAVILHGDGRSDTWNGRTSYQVHKFLTRRYYDFGSDVGVYVADMAGGGQKMRAVNPVGDYLAASAEAHGEITFENIASMNGAMRWWIIPNIDAQRTSTHSAGTVPGGVGLIVDDEIFDYAKTYLGDFGVIYSKVQSRVAILVVIDGAEMGTSRADVTLPGGSRKTVPWKKFGAYFAANMPAEIDELLSAVTVKSSSFDAEMAKALDEEWMKKLEPIKVHLPSRAGVPSTGKQPGDALPPGKDFPHRERGASSSRKRRRAAERAYAGEEPGTLQPKVVTPLVEFIDDWDYAEHPYGITWFQTSNKVLIHEGFKPFVREVARWCERVTHPRQIVEDAVRGAYQIEYAATIIDANAQAKFKLTADQIEVLKSEAALYAKALGMQSLTDRIERYMRDIAKQA